MATKEPVTKTIPEDKLNELLYERSTTELWCDKHNHSMSLIRTLAAVGNMILSSIIILKVFEVI